MRFFLRAALVEPEALAVHLKVMDMVGDAVEQGAAETFGAEALVPFIEGQLGDEHRRLQSIAAHDATSFVSSSVCSYRIHTSSALRMLRR